MPPPSPLQRRPHATAFSIEDLLDRVRRGEIRIPEFQRPFRWKAKDVVALLDSVYRGYPIGTLLFWKKEAPAASFFLGPVRIDAPHSTEALWVVDGQQRITALTGALLHLPHTEGEHDNFVVYFDLEHEALVRPSKRSPPPSHWLPMNVVVDSEMLLGWLDRYPGRAQKPEHMRTALRLGKAFREYRAPAYIVEADEEQTLRVIFDRLNSAGKPLRRADVFNALHGSTGEAEPSDLRALSERLQTLRFGTIDEQWLLKAVLAVRGLDITRDFRQQIAEESELSEALRQAEHALRATIIFLKRDVEIPHIELLPYKLPLVLLARFFTLHPEPHARSRELLARWVWRGAITEHHRGESIPAVRKSLSVIGSDEERTIQALLSELPPTSPKHLTLSQYNFRTAQTKLQANALLALHPRHLQSGEFIDASALLEKEGSAAFKQLLEPTSPHLRNLANRIFHPLVDGQSPLELLRGIPPPAPEVLLSHGIPTESIDALHHRSAQHDLDFFRHRESILDAHVWRFLNSRARWDESDRRSLQSLIVPDEED
ncbi:DUF262 domain-containing protein [Archangium violaceum]|uniref:DUF262 domain-containing protein n=1 Tax=Archangium violaceum TaxID=83451 RepID=UPI00193C4192|nr:DUF262 domain-containing protein [Archangium violaceum]QRK06535.1 DUF262 domain-containing protein [Archangium violaceum]